MHNDPAFRPTPDELRRADERARSTPPRRARAVLEQLQEKTPERAGGGGRAAPRPIPADFLEELRRRAPTIARTVDELGGSAALEVLELPAPPVVRAPADVVELELVARPKWEPHRFPERTRSGRPRQLGRDVKRARAPYPCESIDRALGHTATIQPGEQYLRLQIPPDGAGGVRSWRHVRLCRACAIAYGLAVPHTPGGS